MAEKAMGFPPLWDRYLKQEGRVYLTGSQALARLCLDQVRRDRAAGLRVGAFCSGAGRGALGDLDEQLRELTPLFESQDVRFVPIENEALAASAVAGTQLLDLVPHAGHDGVVGLWFGSSAGLERALAPLHEANFRGISRAGGAVAVVGDDPTCARARLPSHSPHALAHLAVPVLCPSHAEEILTLGRQAFALSRFAGTWVALEVGVDVAQSGQIVELSGAEPDLVLPKLEMGGRSFCKRLDPGLVRTAAPRIEQELVFERLEAVRRYAEANALDVVEQRHPRDRVGLVASGRLARELRTALDLLGIGDGELEELGIRLLRVQLLFPFPSGAARGFAGGLDEVLVIDERPGFLEDQVRAALCSGFESPRVLGQRDESGAPWLARHGEISSATLALDLGAHLARILDRPDLERRTLELEARAKRGQAPLDLGPEGARASDPTGDRWAGAKAPAFRSESGLEGAAWIGLAPYSDASPPVETLDPASYAESGRLAVRAVIRAGVRITYVVPCGVSGLDTEGSSGTPCPSRIARDLLSDGVQRIVAITCDPVLRAMAEAERRVEIASSSEIEQVVRDLRAQPGVSAVILDRSRSSRGAWDRAEPAGTRLAHADLWDGVGEPPVHLTVEPCTSALPAEARQILARRALPEPRIAPLRQDGFRIAIRGSSDPGVALIESTLLRAAEIEGLDARHVALGTASTDVRIAPRVGRRESFVGSPRISLEGADLVLALDPAAARDRKGLRVVRREKTCVLVDGDSDAPLDELLVPARGAWSVPAAGVAEAVLGTPAQAPLVLLGAALQHGVLPVGATSLECALRDLQGEVEEALLALRLGRCAVLDPAQAAEEVEAARPPAASAAGSPADAAECLGPPWNRFARALDELPNTEAHCDLRRDTAGLALDLVEYQDRDYAHRYLSTLQRVLEAEVRVGARAAHLTADAARQLHRVLAYPDEYEIARLLIRGPFRRWLRGRGVRCIRYRLDPSVLGAFRVSRPVELSPRWIDPLLGLLWRCRGLRGTRLDPFQKLRDREEARRRRDAYEKQLSAIADGLSYEGLEAARELLARTRPPQRFAAL